MVISLQNYNDSCLPEVLKIYNSSSAESGQFFSIEQKNQDFIYRLTKGHSKQYPFYVIRLDDEPVGFCKFSRVGLDYATKNVASFVICLDKEKYSEKLYSAALSVIEIRAKEMGFYKLTTYMLSNKHRLAFLIRSKGYRDVGILKKQCYYKGELLDLLLFERFLNTDIEKLNEEYCKEFPFYNTYFSLEKEKHDNAMIKNGLIRSPDNPNKWIFKNEE